ncbi:MAG TPA: hypothetical protein VGB28_02160 [Actinomycetota bacterium]
MTRRKKPARLFAALTALLVLLTVASTVAKAGRDKDRPKESARLARWAAKPDQAGFRGRLMEMATAKDKVKAFRQVARTAIRELGGLARPSQVLPQQATEADHQETLGLLVPAGDLDADGKEDAAALYYNRIAGLRGVNGSALWSHDLSGFGGLLGAGPLDGVAGDDVLVVDVIERELEIGWQWTWTYQALSGKTGTVLWTRTYENVWTFAGAGPSGAYTDVDFAMPFGVGDLSGDGMLDLVVGRYNIAAAGSPSVEEFSSVAIFEVVSGATGTPTAEFPARGRFAYPDALLVPDLSGDQAPDIVTVSPTGSSDGTVTVDLAATSGKGGAPAWRRSLTTSRMPYFEGVNLNSDGRGDLIMGVRDLGRTFTGLNGTNGNTMWERETSSGWIEPVGDVTGDGGQELILVDRDDWYWSGETQVQAPAPAAKAAAKNRGKAARGTLDVPSLPGHEVAVSASTPCYGYGGYGCPPPPVPCYGYGGYGCPPPPPDDDPCDGSYGYGFTIASHYGYGGPCTFMQVMLLNGAVAEEIWSVGHRGTVESVGDGDGDGIGDVALEGYTQDEDTGQWSWTTTMLSGSDAERVWRAQVQGDYVFPLREDMNGDGADDLLLLDFSWFDRYGVVSGATGQPLWPTIQSGGWLWDIYPAALRGQAHDLLETSINPEEWAGVGRGVAGDTGDVLWER